MEDKKNITKDNIDRKDLRFVLDMEVSDIMWKHNQKRILSYLIMISFLLINLIGCIIVEVFLLSKGLDDVAKGISFYGSIVNVVVSLLAYISSNLQQKSYAQSRKYLHDLINKVLPNGFNKDYTVDDESILLKEVSRYKENWYSKYNGCKWLFVPKKDYQLYTKEELAQFEKELKEKIDELEKTRKDLKKISK